MSSFATSFWSSDYAAGLGVLFDKLQQGVQENAQVLTIARMRAEAEELYGQRLGDIVPSTDRIPGGFQRDDGASVRKAYEGIRSEMNEAAKNHYKIASNIRELVVNPFGLWCEQHAGRVQGAQDDLQARIKVHDRQADAVRKLRSHYYNKCRLVEDLEEEDKMAFQEPQSDPSHSPKGKGKEVPTIKEPQVEDEPEPVEIGDQMYHPDQMKKILAHILETVKMGELKVPILGTYQNVSSGSDITEYIQKHMNAPNLAVAEKIGQDLIDNGFLRLVGNVGSTFANSSRMSYQWKSKSFQMAGVMEKKKPLDRVVSLGPLDVNVDSSVNSVSEYLAGWNPLNNPYPNETPAERLRREARESDERYKAGVRRLDELRCNLEEAMAERLKYMERCELDRLKAIKAVILDFSGAISNVIPNLQSTVDKMMLFQETVQPVGDLRYLLENYQTGNFVPKVQIYENYYNNVDEQTFGVDLEARSRADRKRVPIIISTLLQYLDNHYPDLEGDEARRAIWLVDVPLHATHSLRSQINNGKPISHDLLEKFEIPVVASVLKLYLLELPDPVVSAHVYDIIKTIYTNTATDSSEATRIQVIQNTLGTLRLANIATLDALTTHFSRLIELTSADEAYVAALATNLAPCILRPKHETTLTMNERFAYRLLRDLIAHKDAVFGELKRASSLKMRERGGQPFPEPTAARGPPPAAAAAADPASPPPGAVEPRGRGFSTTRREAEQERHQAIIAAAGGAASVGSAATGANRSRNPSPNPAHRQSIRRERSPHRMSGSADTRFPVAPQTGASPTEAARRSGVRASLEVPGAVLGMGQAQGGGEGVRGVELTDRPMDD